jgi:hypothetical protein
MTDISGVLLKLKREHRQLLAFELPVSESHQTSLLPFVFRTLTVKEYEEYTRLGEIGDISDEIVSATILYPPAPLEENPIQKVVAGLYEALAFQIVLASGLTDPSTAKGKIAEGRHAARKFTSIVEMFICKAFPRYVPDDIKNMTLDEQMELLGQAEQILGIEFPVKEFFGKPRPAESDIPKDFARLATLTDGDIERITEGAITKEALARVSQKQTPEGMAANRQALKARIARQRSIEGD